MVKIELNIANEDIPSVRRWAQEQKQDLVKLMVAGQPTRTSCDATLAYTIVCRIVGQLGEHDELVAKLNQEEKAARRGK